MHCLEKDARNPVPSEESVETKIISFLQSKNQPCDTTSIRSAVGLATKKKINPVLYSLQEQGIIKKVQDTPATWKVCPGKEDSPVAQTQRGSPVGFQTSKTLDPTAMGDRMFPAVSACNTEEAKQQAVDFAMIEFGEVPSTDMTSSETSPSNANPCCTPKVATLPTDELMYNLHIDEQDISRRPFGKSAENISYMKGKQFLNLHEDRKVEFKALTQERRERLPWKIMEKARIFICGILNSGEQGTIYFGVGDSKDDNTNFTHGEIVGLEVKNLKDEISEAFQSMLKDHITSDEGEMKPVGDMTCVTLYFVPVTDTELYVIEIDVKREWAFCEDYVYYVQEWENRKPSDRYGLHDMYKVSVEKDVAYVRTCGSSQSIRSSKIKKSITEPLSQKYKQWKDSRDSHTDSPSISDGEKSGPRKVRELDQKTYRKIIEAFSRNTVRLNELPGEMNLSYDVVDILRRDVNTEIYVDRLITHWSEEDTTHDIPKFIKILGKLKMGELKDTVTREFNEQRKR